MTLKAMIRRARPETEFIRNIIVRRKSVSRTHW